MHENEFEKKMQEKMEELKFAPSDAIWANVDKEINKEKKRRRPVFWLYFFFGMALLGGGYFFAVNITSLTHQVIAEQPKNTDRQYDQPSIAKDEEQVDENKIKVHELEKSIETTKTPESNKETGNTNQSFQKTVTRKSQHINSILNSRAVLTSSASKRRKENSNADTAIVAKNVELKPTKENVVGKNESLAADDTNKKSRRTTEISSTEKKDIDSSVNRKAELADEHKPSTNDPTSETKVVQDKKQQSKPSKWKLGFTESTGISNINQNLFRSTYVTNPSNYSPASSVLPNGTTAINTSSKINPDLSFTTGVFVSRYLSKRISFSAGINYHYYSTKIEVGHSIDSTIYIYAFGASTPATQARSYYRNGNSSEYINRYHFIELPLSMNFQLNKSLKLPVMWQAGLSPVYLAGSNALHFDPVTNVYYKNYSLFNKFQLNAATAIMVGFHIHKNELQLGPQLEYGLTHILNKSTGNPEHLFYTGLKVLFIPRKK